MATLYSNIGQKADANLLADPQGAVKITVPLTPGKGEIAVGTLVYRKANGFWEPAATAQMDGSAELAVIREAVDTGSVATGIAEDGLCYRAGRFINGTVKYYNTTATKYEAPTAAMKLQLRKLGIVFDKATTDAEFNNEVT